MSFATILRCVLIIALISWAFLDYCFVRSAFGVVMPGLGALVIILALALLLMIPMIFVALLWILPDARHHRLAIVRQNNKQCPSCGQSLKESGSKLCPECGPGQYQRLPSIRTLVLTCVIIWLGAWLLGAVAGETLVRLDESSFIEAHQHSGDAPDHQQRHWPLWGSLQWDPVSETAKASMD
ncbi:MAG: hypothetical protein VX527_09055 [Planctomycetota bacterium]|nr:hypothetical protein [Planctomycetota bacterium]